MIEITTGIVFLMSSLYGSGQADTHVANIAAESQSGKSEMVALVEEVRPLIDKQEIVDYLKSETKDTPLLVDIAWCESRLNQYNEKGIVVRGEKVREDVGIFQINERYHKENAEKMGIDIYTAEGNIEYGKYLYEKYGSKPWSASSKCWTNPELAFAGK